MRGKDRLMVLVAVLTSATTVSLSMLLNVWAFTRTLEGWFGVSVGILLPLWVLALTLAGKHATERPGLERLGYAAYALAGFLLVVSLPHLAAGYGLLGLHWWEQWSLAIVTDLCQVLMKALVIAMLKDMPAAATKKTVKRKQLVAKAA
jgi:predicted membrane channel-forming protein YqfA (hemolysin III family)